MNNELRHLLISNQSLKISALVNVETIEYAE